MKGHESDVVTLDFSLDDKILVSGSTDGTICVWDLATGAARQTFFGVEPEYSHPAVTSVMISPNGQYVAVGSMDTVIRIWDINSDDLVERLEGHWGYVYGVAWMPDGKSLVSGGLDATVKYWHLGGIGPQTEPESQRSSCKMTFAGHQVRG